MKTKPRGSGEQPDYLSYMLRLWRVRGEKTTWRASLESARTGETQTFVSSSHLCDYLRGQMGFAPESNGGEEEDDEHATTVILVIHRAGRKRK